MGKLGLHRTFWETGEQAWQVNNNNEKQFWFRKFQTGEGSGRAGLLT